MTRNFYVLKHINGKYVARIALPFHFTNDIKLAQHFKDRGAASNFKLDNEVIKYIEDIGDYKN